jgi:hypothetical protein
MVVVVNNFPQKLQNFLKNKKSDMVGGGGDTQVPKGQSVRKINEIWKKKLFPRKISN